MSRFQNEYHVIDYLWVVNQILLDYGIILRIIR